jgi:hypothetical protein
MTTKSFEAVSDQLLEEYMSLLLGRVEDFVWAARRVPTPQEVETLGGRLAEAEGRLAELRRKRAN